MFLVSTEDMRYSAICRIVWLDEGNNSDSTVRTLESAHNWGILLYHRQTLGAATNIVRVHFSLSGLGSNDLITSFVALAKISPLYFDVVDLVRPPNT